MQKFFQVCPLGSSVHRAEGRIYELASNRNRHFRWPNLDTTVTFAGLWTLDPYSNGEIWSSPPLSILNVLLFLRVNR